MPFQQFKPTFVSNSSINKYELRQLKPEIAQFLRETKNDDVLGLILAHFNYPVIERIPGFPPFTQLVISLDIQNVLGSGVATDLTSKFETEGWIVLREDGTDNKFQVKIAQRDVTEPYEYRFEDTTIIDQWRTFNSNRTGFDNLILELWDEEPTETPQPQPTPIAPTEPHQNWDIILHNALQHIPNFLFLRERVFPDVIPEGQDYTKPHIVWYQTGNVKTSAMDGQIETGVRVSIDFRSPSRNQCNQMRYRIIAFLINIGIVDRVVSASSLYDFDTKIRREIVDVIVFPYTNPQSNPYTRFSPWGNQFAGNFG